MEKRLQEIIRNLQKGLSMELGALAKFDQAKEAVLSGRCRIVQNRVTFSIQQSGSR